MRLERRARYSIAGIALAIALGGAVITRAQSGPPSDSAVAFAAEVSDLLHNELVAALFQEFNETTPHTFHTACVLCHTNFTPEFFTPTNNPGQWAGALVLRVPIGARN
jgi:hypothetical protein